MNDQTKLALFDALLTYLIQSSSAMDGTIKALATGALVSPLVLNEAIDSAKVLLSKVIQPSINIILLDCFSCV
jgi:Na+/phosphate symporter